MDRSLLSRMAHPVEGAASPLSPGPAASRGRPAPQLAGPRAASRRLRHLRANAPPQPGPTTASTRGRRRAAARGARPGPRALRAWPPHDRGLGGADGPPQRSAEPQPPGPRDPGPRARPPERTPSSSPGGTVCGASGRAQGPGPATQPRRGGGSPGAEGGATSHRGGATRPPLKSPLPPSHPRLGSPGGVGAKFSSRPKGMGNGCLSPREALAREPLAPSLQQQ